METHQAFTKAMPYLVNPTGNNEVTGDQVVATYVNFSFLLGYLIKAHLHTYKRETTAAGGSPSNTLNLGYIQAHRRSHQSMKYPSPQAQRSTEP